MGHYGSCYYLIFFGGTRVETQDLAFAWQSFISLSPQPLFRFFTQMILIWVLKISFFAYLLAMTNTIAECLNNRFSKKYIFYFLLFLTALEAEAWTEGARMVGFLLTLSWPCDAYVLVSAHHAFSQRLGAWSVCIFVSIEGHHYYSRAPGAYSH